MVLYMLLKLNSNFLAYNKTDILKREFQKTIFKSNFQLSLWLLDAVLIEVQSELLILSEN